MSFHDFRGHLLIRAIAGDDFDLWVIERVKPPTRTPPKLSAVAFFRTVRAA
jgi:hypothetical protein